LYNFYRKHITELPTVWDHTLLPATRDRWTCLTSTSARQAGAQFAYPGGTEGWVDQPWTLVDVYILRLFACLPAVTHPSSNHLIVSKPEVEPTTSRLQI